jgi:UPF0042 nucleotide-binding protein
VNTDTQVLGRPAEATHAPRRVVLVTGLSGAGKASILRILEDLGYEAVDNPPLRLMEDLVLRGERPAAICVDTRSRGFDPHDILAVLARLKRNPDLRPELLFAYAEEAALLRRFTETRRRHPMAATGRVADGVALEIEKTAALRAQADLLLDTSELKLPMLRRIIEQRFSGNGETEAGMSVSLMSFAYPAGLPREAELVFDARFLRNPHYDPILRDKTGLDPDVAAYVEADPDFRPFIDKVTDLLTLLLPRFVQEGKKYVSVAIGCTGGQHRSVHTVQVLADRLRRLQGDPPVAGGPPHRCGPVVSRQGCEKWRVGVTHRELMRGPGGNVAGTSAAESIAETERAGTELAKPGAGGLTDTP